MGKVERRGDATRRLVIEILKNGGTLEDAAAATGYGLSYVRQLGAKEGIRFRRVTHKEQIIELYNTGKSSQEVAEIFGMSRTSVCRIWRDAGLGRQLTPLQQKVKELRERGKVCSEISDELDIPNHEVRQTAIAVGMPFTEEEKQRSIAIGSKKGHERQHGSEADRKKKADEFIQENYSGWSYIDGLIGGSGKILLKCSRCGTITERSAVTIRHKTGIICPKCRRREEERKKTEEEKEKATREKAKSEEKTRRFWSQDFTQIGFKHCKECGALHLEKGCFCSDECRRKHTNRQHDKRLRRAEKIDTSITLEKLYKRDAGICWICGGRCNYNDSETDDLGNFIVGPSYPSIDHVYPLSRGGSHTWDNVRLAHHRCNTLKSDKVVS